MSNRIAPHIMRATAESIDQIAPLFDAYRVFYHQPSDLPGARAYLRQRLGNEESVIFWAMNPVDEAPWGFTQLYPSFSSVSMQPVWILYDLYVVPERRRHGVGRALMEHARYFASESGAHSITLATALDNIPGQRLYESLGYVRDEEFYYYELLL